MCYTGCCIEVILGHSPNLSNQSSNHTPFYNTELCYIVADYSAADVTLEKQEHIVLQESLSNQTQRIVIISVNLQRGPEEDMWWTLVF